jgi:hypothetical protein
MEIRNNLFAYAPKELLTDAFLAWLFIELDQNPVLSNSTSHVFLSLICAVDRIR